MAVNNYPLSYLITFTCYGTRLHGSELGSVERGKWVPPNDGMEGSAVYLWDTDDVARAIEYVMNQSGRALASYWAGGLHGELPAS